MTSLVFWKNDNNKSGGQVKLVDLSKKNIKEEKKQTKKDKKESEDRTEEKSNEELQN